jgi:hypothetical protein
MNTYMTDADLYVTMHTGVWIMLYPWGKWPEQPPDWELFHFIRDDVHASVSDIPIQNANQGLYPNCGTSRDYGYGKMGFPTFTFETDDEQFVPGTFESLHDRWEEEMDVMRYLINEVWYWRARLDVQALTISDDSVEMTVANLGRASTSNASLQHLDASGEVVWSSPMLTVNASNVTEVSFDLDMKLDADGTWELMYQKRVINASQWVNESINASSIQFVEKDEGNFLTGFGLFNPLSVILSLLGISVITKREDEV